MKIITCKKFNELQMKKWHRDVKRQSNSQPSLILPNITYGVRNKNGVLRKSGFVLFEESWYRNRHMWFKTKKKALAMNNKKSIIESKTSRQKVYYFIEDNGYDGLSFEKCETLDSLIKVISESDALIPQMLIEGKEIKIDWPKTHRGTWNKKKPTDIPELGIHIPGQKGIQ